MHARCDAGQDASGTQPNATHAPRLESLGAEGTRVRRGVFLSVRPKCIARGEKQAALRHRALKRFRSGVFVEMFGEFGGVVKERAALVALMRRRAF